MQLDNLWYSPEFDAAIEAKQAAAQRALEEKERAAGTVAAAEGKAQATVAEARGAAESRVARARGDAEAIALTSAAEAEANRRIAASVTNDLIRLEAVKKIEGTKVAILPSGSTILDPGALIGSVR